MLFQTSPRESKKFLVIIEIPMVQTYTESYFQEETIYSRKGDNDDLARLYDCKSKSKC
jgi:hypothetical protein